MKPGVLLNSLSPKHVALDPELNDGGAAAVPVGRGTSHAVIQGTTGLTEERRDAPLGPAHVRHRP